MLKCLEIKRYIFPTYSQTGQKYIELENAGKLHLRVHFTIFASFLYDRNYITKFEAINNSNQFKFYTFQRG